MLVTKFSLSSRLPFTRDTAATLPNASRSCCGGISSICDHRGGALDAAGASNGRRNVPAPCQQRASAPLADSAASQCRQSGDRRDKPVSSLRSRPSLALQRSEASAAASRRAAAQPKCAGCMRAAQGSACGPLPDRHSPRKASRVTVGATGQRGARDRGPRPRCQLEEFAAGSPQTPDRAAWQGASGSWAPG